MNKISIETNIGFGLIFSVSFWAAVDGKVPFSLLLIPPIAYGIMYFFISIFIWDKRRQLKITIPSPSFVKGDLLKIGRNENVGLVVDVKDNGHSIDLTVFPVKEGKYRLINTLRIWYIKVSCWLRGVGR